MSLDEAVLIEEFIAFLKKTPYSVEVLARKLQLPRRLVEEGVTSYSRPIPD